MLCCPSLWISLALALLVNASEPSRPEQPYSQRPITLDSTGQQLRHLLHRRQTVTQGSVITAGQTLTTCGTTPGQTGLATDEERVPLNNGNIATITLSSTPYESTFGNGETVLVHALQTPCNVCTLTTICNGDTVTVTQRSTPYPLTFGTTDVITVGALAANATYSTPRTRTGSTTSNGTIGQQSSFVSTSNAGANSGGLTNGAKAGIGVGAALGCLIFAGIGAIGALWWIRRSRQKTEGADEGSTSDILGNAKEGGSDQAIELHYSSSLRRELATGEEAHEMSSGSKAGELEGSRARPKSDEARYELATES